MICCGESTETKFCPHCGKPLEASGLAGLLKHCKSQLQQQVTRHRQAVEAIEAVREANKNNQRDWLGGRVDRFRIQKEKWTMWVKELEELTAKAAERV